MVLLWHRVCLVFPQHKVFLRQFSTGDERLQTRQPIKSNDESEWVVRPHVLVFLEGWGNTDLVTFLWCLLCFVFPVLFKVYCCDNTYTTIRASVAASARELIGALAEKLGSAEDLLLVSLGSAGGGSGSCVTHSSRESFYWQMSSWLSEKLGSVCWESDGSGELLNHTLVAAVCCRDAPLKF